MQLYAPSTKSGVIDLIYRNTGADTTKYPLAEVTADINLALDFAIAKAINSSGSAQFDDTNHPKYPIIYLNLVDGQRDYSFTQDEQSNLVLDIYRVLCADSNGRYYDLNLVDQQVRGYTTIPMVDGQNLEGYPSEYDKTGSGIFLDPIPNYSYTKGLKIFINREGYHFTTPTVGVADTTIPGIDGRLHEYLAVRPTTYYAIRKNLLSAAGWQAELLKWEGNEDAGITGMIESVYSKRSRDEQTRIIPTYRNPR